MQEIFKDIENAEGLYQVSNLGNVRSYNNKNKECRLLSPNKQQKGYETVTLKGNINKMCSIHRLVAKAFIPNPQNKKEVNHINGIKNDNRLENLEWATSSENRVHAYKTGLQKGHQKRGKDSPLSMPVIQLTLDGKFVAKYAAGKEAARQIRGHAGSINRCCNGKNKSSSGFKWEFSI